MATPTPVLATGASGSATSDATALASGAALSPTSTASDFDHLSASCTSLQSYLHVEHDDEEVIKGIDSVALPIGSGSDSVISEDDEIVWPKSPQVEALSPLAVSDHEQDTISFASNLSLSMSAMSLMSSSIHPLSQLGTANRNGRAHTRSRSVPILGEDIVLVGSRAASTSPLAVNTRFKGAALPLENSQVKRNLLWSEEVERVRAIVEEPESCVGTPTRSVFVEAGSSIASTPTVPTSAEGKSEDSPKVMGPAWKRRNRRRKAAAAMAAAAAAAATEGVEGGQGSEGTASKRKTTLPHLANVIEPYAPTPGNGTVVAQQSIESINADDGGKRHERGCGQNESSSVSTNGDGDARSYPLSTRGTPASGAEQEQERSVTPPIRPRAPEPVHVAPRSVAAVKKKSKARNEARRKEAESGKPDMKTKKTKSKTKTKKARGSASKIMSQGKPAHEVPGAVNKTSLEEESETVTAQTYAGLGERPVVDDVSENGDEKERLLSTAYEEAVNFMNQFILNPSYYTSRASRLTFLQALILELGLCHEFSLPTSLSGARALLRSHAFLNVRDYLAVRSQGLDALRDAMYPSRNALVKDLRTSKKSVKGPEGSRGVRAELGWVKETGLTVLLVSCYQH